jgi:hypothetical protein
MKIITDSDGAICDADRLLDVHAIENAVDTKLMIEEFLEKQSDIVKVAVGLRLQSYTNREIAVMTGYSENYIHGLLGHDLAVLYKKFLGEKSREAVITRRSRPNGREN